jgi:hypothetical protein
MNELQQIYQLSNAEIVKITGYLDDIEPKLTIKQRKFAYFYIMNGFNGSEACRQAGYKSHKDIDNNEIYRVIGCINLQKVNIKDAIRLISDNIIKDKSEIQQSLFNIHWKRANYDILTFQNDDGSFKSLNEIPQEWRCCIDGTETKYYGKDANVKVVVSKLPDRNRALEFLDKLIQMTKEPNEDKNVMTDTVMQNLLKVYGEKTK